MIYKHGMFGFAYIFFVLFRVSQDAVAVQFAVPSHDVVDLRQSVNYLHPEVSGKESPPQVLILNPDTDEAQTPVTPIYHQIAKTGITSILTLMVAGLGNASIRDDPFHHAYQGAQRRRPGDFYIGTIRNPCNYYVSLWSYNAETNNSQMRKELNSEEDYEFFVDVTANKSSAHDKQVFKSFTKAITGSLGVFTGRLAYGYIPYTPVGRNFTTIKVQKITGMIVQSMMEDWNTSTVDCWVDTATVAEDAAICLQMLEKDYGVNVHWDDFEAAKGNHNPSKHGRCKDYYDEELESFVRQKDADVFKKFGYDSCCDSISAIAAHRTHNLSPARS